jgi:hypothetical protein
MAELNEENLFDSIDNTLKLIAGKLKNKISPQDVSIKAKIPFKVVSIREIFLHRTYDLAISSNLLFKEKKLIPTILLVRALMETNAIFYRINKLSKEAIDKKDPEELDNEAMIVLCGTKDKEEKEYKAKNILGYLEKIEKTYPDYKEIYDRLSEFAHPNHDGCLGTYGQIEEETQTTYLGFDLKYNYFFYIETLKFLLLNLEIYMKEYEINEKFLPELIAVCEENLKKNNCN